MRQMIDHHAFTGMQRDLEISKHPANYLYDAHNIRLTARGDDTLLAITNEKGPLYTGIEITGTYLGHCLLGKYLVIFSTTTEATIESPSKIRGSLKYVQTLQQAVLTPAEIARTEPTPTDSPILPWQPQAPATPLHAPTAITPPPDYITRINLDTGEKLVLYNGNLEFSPLHPIETLASYENEEIQKVYWTDGNKQPRIINIARPDDILEWGEGGNTQFDFVRELALNETVTVRKLLGTTGSFPAGVIQYAFTYYTKYQQESNVFYVSPLLYTSFRDRGGSPEDKVANAFEITIANFDRHFDYLRIYSIQRTSINGTPIVKRVQDIRLKGLPNSTTSVSFIDTGIGDALDAKELLYKGGESIIAQTIEQKDNTLFLGNIKLERPSLKNYESAIKTGMTITSGTRVFFPTEITKGDYEYDNQLTAFTSYTREASTSCNGFKRGDYYRCGVQFQYRDGTWSDPIFINDVLQTSSPSKGTYIASSSAMPTISVPVFNGVLSNTVSADLYAEGYRRVRAVVVYPEVQDRVVVSQGVLNSTMYTHAQRTQRNLYAQSSWFFRPFIYNNDYIESDGTASPKVKGVLEYTHRGIEANVPSTGDTAFDPSNLRLVEVQGDFISTDYDAQTGKGGTRFKTDEHLVTFHSPDIEFEDYFQLLDFAGLSYRIAGVASFTKTMSDIEIQTETPPISNKGGGFIHKSFTKPYSYGIVSGLFFEDYFVDDNGQKFFAYVRQKSPVKWVVYPWHRTGSINNDINRPADAGARTAMLKKKVISNLRYSTTVPLAYPETDNVLTTVPQLFNSDQLTIIKVGGEIYQGNIDTALVPDNIDGTYFAFGRGTETDINVADIDTPFISTSWGKTFSRQDTTADAQGVYMKTANGWQGVEGAIGDEQMTLTMSKDPVRMKYKSTPHLVMSLGAWEITPGTASSIFLEYETPPTFPTSSTRSVLPIIELIRPGDSAGSYYRSTMFGGQSQDALKANLWIPCGEPVALGSATGGRTEFQYSYGDTYYQRWDCLKTYPFTFEDINQIVEIGSFMLETRVNVEGRYDRNRGQVNNLNMSPINFNLLNPVYSQINNYFTYRILDEDYYNISTFPNQFTWTKEKQVGGDTDLWTNITLGSTYDADGSKGAITSINKWKDQLLCFQDKGISTIMFNSRVQIPASDGVPIEISNNYKVDGCRYISEGIGCVNKWTIANTPSGIYFICAANNHLYHVGEGLSDITATHNMTSWFNSIEDNEVTHTLYDDMNHDLYLIIPKVMSAGATPTVIRDEEALCYSELLGQFTSFFDYKKLVLLESYGNYVYAMRGNKLYFMFKGVYNSFFGENKSWEFTFISNGLEAGTVDNDKIFSIIDYRMDMFDSSSYAPGTSLEYIQASNEYQDTGKVDLVRLFSPSKPMSYNHKDANLQKKFKIWRIQIPRNANSLDRIRNPWCKITLGNKGQNTNKAILHDLNVQYFI